MKISERKLKVSELVAGYTDDGEDGVFGFGGKLSIRPAYQREFVYKDAQRNAVIDSVLCGYPLNVMYWSKVGDDKYEVLDGQQRTISICQFINSGFSMKIDGNAKFYHNLTEDEKQIILNYELSVYVCEGNESEKLAWFKRINIPGAVLTEQELLNATYTGTWLSDAKNYFSRRNCVAGKVGEGFIKGNPIRQDYLEKALAWIALRDGLASGEQYMALHQHDADASDIWLYFQEVIAWAKRYFPDMDKKLTEAQDWGALYNKHKTWKYNPSELKKEVSKLLEDDDVTKQTGIIPYVLSEKTRHDERYLSIRAFSDQMKRRVYQRQTEEAEKKHLSNCPYCAQEGLNKIYEYSEMQGDHIVAWRNGGKTVESNLQMLCAACNNAKSGK